MKPIQTDTKHQSIIHVIWYRFRNCLNEVTRDLQISISVFYRNSRSGIFSITPQRPRSSFLQSLNAMYTTKTTSFYSFYSQQTPIPYRNIYYLDLYTHMYTFTFSSTLPSLSVCYTYLAVTLEKKDCLTKHALSMYTAIKFESSEAHGSICTCLLNYNN